MKNNHVAMLEMKPSINQIETTANKIKQKKEYQRWRTRLKHANYHKAKNKKNTHEYNIQELCDMIKRPKTRNLRVEERAKTQAIGIGNIFNEIIAEYFQNQYNNLDMYRKHFKLQIYMVRKDQPHNTS
jgi:hypothetical protein